MRINHPISREAADENRGGDFQPLPAGIYRGIVIDAEEKTSKSGNEMIVLTIETRDPETEAKRRVWDYLVDMDSMAWKLRHFCDAANIADHYEAGDVTAAMCKGSLVRVSLEIEPAKDQYPAKNIVADYLAPDEIDAKLAQPGGEHVTIPDSDVPF